VGRVELVLNIPASRSLKEKRRVIKSLIARIHNQYNASVAEVGENDKWQLARLGIALVSNRTDHANSRISAILNMVAREPAVVIIDQHIEIN
jgi:uncharacterized protein YlxP (DUF503 family)